MSDLVAFLQARLDEDERIARDADDISRDEWLTLYEDLVRSRPLDDARAVFGIFIGTFTSARVLADIAAKRQLITEHYATQGVHGGLARQVCTRCSDYAERGELARPDLAPCGTMRLLALPYASHRDYRKEWRPRTVQSGRSARTTHMTDSTVLWRNLDKAAERAGAFFRNQRYNCAPQGQKGTTARP
ncbi:DUF6221 family protein [Nonomuraea sp. NPDC047897]|uniref:DUF6221 family protein n=1 Tax=Nonomuraea sp. NPDC047897 TaxID=3364346 RepID=UPI00371BFBD0